MLKRVVDKDGNMSGAKLAEVISIIDVSTDGLQALLHKYGVEVLEVQRQNYLSGN
jgi:hypothetical protein